MIEPLLLALAACSPPATEADPLALRYGDTEVRRSTYEDWLVARSGEELAPVFALCFATRLALEERGLTVDPERVRAAAEADLQQRVDGAFRGDRERFLAELASAGRSHEGRIVELSIEAERDLGLAAIAEAERVVEDADVHAEWERLHGPGGRTIDVRMIHLHLDLEGEPGETRAETQARREEARVELRQRAVALRERLVAGEDFERAARLLSEDESSRSRGGVPLRPFRIADWPEEERSHLAGLAPGEISEPVFARGGYWLVLVEALRTTPLAEVEAAIRADLATREATPSEVSRVTARIASETLVEPLAPLTAPDAPETSYADEAIALRVAGHDVPRARYARWLRRYRGEVYAARFVEERLIEEAAAENGVTASREEVLQRLDDEIARQIEVFHRGDAEDWRGALAVRGLSEETYRRRALSRTRLDLLCDRLLRLERRPDDTTLRAAWELTYGPGGRDVALRWIRLDLPTAPDDAQTSEEAFERWRSSALSELEERGATLRRRILGGEDFATLAEENSDDPVTRPRGGVPTDAFRIDMLPDALAVPIAALGPGEVTAPLPWQDSVWLIEVTGRSETPFESVRESLAREIRERAANPTEIAAKKLELTRDVEIARSPSLFD